PSKRRKSGQTAGKPCPAPGDAVAAGNPRRALALERGGRTRVCRPLGNRNAIVVQGASDATLTARSDQLVLPAQPILIIDLTFPAHRRHLQDLPACVDWFASGRSRGSSCRSLPIR